MRSRVNNKARPRLGHPHAFKDYEDDGKIHQSMVGFLQDVWQGAPKDSYFFLATSDPEGHHWREHVVHANNELVGLNTFFHAHSRWEHNLYFCPNPFSQKRRKKKFALPSSVGWCDMDDSYPTAYQPEASLLWETSPERYQALWLWDKRHSVEEAENYSRALAERHGGDTGFSITKMLRIPGSINHKPKYDEPLVRLVSRDWNRIAERPEPLAIKGRSYSSQTLVLDVDYRSHKRLDVLKKHRLKLDRTAKQLIRHNKAYAPDRSAQIFHMVTSLHEVGASLDEIASVIWDSPYFQDKYPDDTGALHAELSRIMSKIGCAS